MKSGFSEKLSELNSLKDSLTGHELFIPSHSPSGYSAVGPWEMASGDKLALVKDSEGFSDRFGHGKTFTRSDLRQSGGNP